ncbi:hypothetical protein KI387_002850, partial [Taxus chinensis]
HVKTSLARALSDEYVDAGMGILLERHTDSSLKEATNHRLTRALKAVLQHLKKKNPAFQKQLKVNLQDHGFSTMFGTVLNYVTLRLLGQGSDGGDKEAMEKG